MTICVSMPALTTPMFGNSMTYHRLRQPPDDGRPASYLPNAFPVVNVRLMDMPAQPVVNVAHIVKLLDTDWYSS